MSRPPTRETSHRTAVRSILAVAAAILALAGAAGCARVVKTADPTADAATSMPDPVVPGSDARTAPRDTRTPDPGTPDGGACTRITCNPKGGQYCGKIGDNCNGTIECGDCPSNQTCERGLCVGGTDCVASSCQPANGRYCGQVGDGCGHALACGDCPAGQACTSGIGTVAGACTRLVCSAGGVRYCGTIGDGCGGALTCGDCPAGSTCGGSIPGVCAADNCMPITCTLAGGGQYCGRIGNGCGGVLECPATCPGGAACGSGGVPGACPGLPTGGGCTGIACNIDKCAGRPKTTVKGTVYDPGGKLPLYNVMVYVPNAPLDDLVEGVSCQKCDTTVSGQPVASALTDAAGNFTMSDVPVGSNVPVVIQTGKWRRQVSLPEVRACQDNVFTGVDMFRLPRTQSEGHLPKIAMTRGGADSLECLLRRIGVSDGEFTNPDGTGRVNIYYETGAGTGYASGVAFPPVANLFNPAVIRQYDMMIISCHGESERSRAQPLAEKQIVKDFVDQGGRVFGSHFSFGYFRRVVTTTADKAFQPSPWPLIATWDGNSDAPYNIDTSFPKGMAYADWLVNVGASTTRGQITLTSVESPAMSLTPGLAQSWITSTGDPGIPYFSVPMPVEKAATPADQCGRFVHTGIHVTSGGNGGPFPTQCGTAALTPQEKALEFLIFELSACALPDTQRPTAPIVPPPGVPMSPPGAVTTPPAPPPPPPPPPPPIVP
jgi:hypothetical protein